MSVNTVDASNGRLTLQGDYVIYHADKVEFSLEGNQLPNLLKGTHKGKMFVTNLRIIFVNDTKKGYNTFSMDFQGIRNTEVKQPVFGANFLKGYVKSEPNGGWEGNANFIITFPSGGAIEFAEKFQQAVKQSLRNRQTGAVPPPPQQPTMPGGFYPPPPAGMMYLPGQPMMYPPPQQGIYAYGPPGAVPPPGQPYTAPNGQAPPPYYQQATAQAQHSAPPNQKAQEAYMNGNNVYVPADAPPPYNPGYDHDKNK